MGNLDPKPLEELLTSYRHSGPQGRWANNFGGFIFRDDFSIFMNSILIFASNLTISFMVFASLFRALILHGFVIKFKIVWTFFLILLMTFLVLHPLGETLKIYESYDTFAWFSL